MSVWDALETLLGTDLRDVGCAETFRLIDTYAEIVVNGGRPEQSMPGVTIHLASCDPCAEDMRGLLAALHAAGDPG